MLYGRVARAPDSDPLRMLTFAPGTLLPATGQYVRRIGRPRNEWAVMLYKEYCKMGVGLNRSIHVEPEWREAVCQYCVGSAWMESRQFEPGPEPRCITFLYNIY